jgi:hypothetical protein
MGRLVLGKPSLSNAWCSTCNADTLHIAFGICNHCKKGTAIGERERAVLANSSKRGMASAQKVMASRRRSIWEPVKAKVIEWLKARPDDSFTEIGRKLGCSRSFVSKVAAERGKLRINQHA